MTKNVQTTEELNSFLDDAWLGLEDTSLLVLPDIFKSQPEDMDYWGITPLRVMNDLDYIGYAAKVFLNVDLLPIQCVILQEMWHRPFPMYVATRGFGKSWLLAVYALLKMILNPPARAGGAGVKIVIVGAAWRQARIIFEYMETIWRNSSRLRSLCKGDKQGPRRDIDRCTMTIGENWAIAIPLGSGEKIRGLRATTILCDEFSCLETNTLVETSDGLIRIGEEYSKDKYLITGDSTCPLEQPDKYIKTPLTDVYEVKLQNGYVIRCSKNHMMMTNSGWKKPLELTNKDFIESENQYVFPTRSVDGVDEKLAWLMGILISEGSINNDSQIGITTTDYNLAKKISDNFDFSINHVREAYTDRRGWNCKKCYQLYKSDKILRNKLYQLGLEYSIVHDKKIPWSILQSNKSCIYAFLEGLFEGDGSCFLFKDKQCDNRLGVAYYSVSEVLCRDVHVLLDKLGYDGYINKRKSTISDKDQWFVRLNAKIAYDFAKHLNIERFQYSLQNCCKFRNISNISWDKNSSRWRTCINRFGKRIQKDFIELKDAQEHIDSIRSMPRFRQVKSVTKLLHKDHLYDYHLPITHSFYAGGSRQHNSIAPDIYETVIQGFAAVSANPLQNVKLQAKIQKMKELGMGFDSTEEFGVQGNQVILSGTASYDFQHFAQYWKRYRTIINSCGDPAALTEIYPEGVPEGFNWKDYSIIRIPYDLVPKGFMDDKILTRAKATTHTGLFQMEYGACCHPKTKIITDIGLKDIIDISVGDMVLTHKGRFKRVIKKMYRYYSGKVFNIYSYGYNSPTILTIDHPVWSGGNDFTTIDSVENFKLSKLNELNNKLDIDVSVFVNNYLLKNNFIYPAPSSLKIPQEIRTQIEKSPNKISEISKEFNVKKSTIRYIKNNTNIPKCSIFSNIKLDKNFGLCVGYYAAEGCPSSKGRSSSFYLDSHVDKSLEFFIEQLSMALKSSIGLLPKIYAKKQNTSAITINSRIFTQFISNVCKGNCYNKVIDPIILFSNVNFIKGFLIGVWNGDGHISKKFATIQLSSLDLILQIRLCLSLFSVNSSILKVHKEKTAIINNKLVNQNDVWKLNISGHDFCKFLEIFYDKKQDESKKQNLIFSNKDYLGYKAKSKTIEDYDGYVYNLEVEDDNSYSLPNMTVHNCFTSDSNGFFKRSLIERCVANDTNVSRQDWPNWCPNTFDAMVRGNSDKRYIFAVDPASESDNFSIAILELHDNHARVVYCWTTTRKEHMKKKRAGFTAEDDFYAFCARKIRELMSVFPCERIGLDAQGGGIAVMESLHNKNNLQPGEIPIWPVINDDKPSETDNEPGLHILELVQFANYEWISQANHGLRKDMEDMTLLFSRFDPVSLELASIEDQRRVMEFNTKYPGKNLKLFDTLEDCVLEIEDMKNELTTIMLTKTGTGVNNRDRWDTPEIKTDTGKKGRLRKDRYSALLIGNMLARQSRKVISVMAYDTIGGYMNDIDVNDNSKSFYSTSPEWMKSGLGDFVDSL